MSRKPQHKLRGLLLLWLNCQRLHGDPCNKNNLPGEPPEDWQQHKCRTKTTSTKHTGNRDKQQDTRSFGRTNQKRGLWFHATRLVTEFAFSVRPSVYNARQPNPSFITLHLPGALAGIGKIVVILSLRRRHTMPEQTALHEKVIGTMLYWMLVVGRCGSTLLATVAFSCWRWLFVCLHVVGCVGMLSWLWHKQRQGAAKAM